MVQEEESRLWGFLAKHIAFVFFSRKYLLIEKDTMHLSDDGPALQAYLFKTSSCLQPVSCSLHFLYSTYACLIFHYLFINQAKLIISFECLKENHEPLQSFSSQIDFIP